MTRDICAPGTSGMTCTSGYPEAVDDPTHPHSLSVEHLHKQNYNFENVLEPLEILLLVCRDLIGIQCIVNCHLVLKTLLFTK